VFKHAQHAAPAVFDCRTVSALSVILLVVAELNSDSLDLLDKLAWPVTTPTGVAVQSGSLVTREL
jgi:hypothetical protein